VSEYEAECESGRPTPVTRTRMLLLPILCVQSVHLLSVPYSVSGTDATLPLA
jgi:hypothetical protein